MINGTPDRIDQIDAMRMGVDYRFMIKCRGFQIDCRPLSISESVDVANQVNEALSVLPEHGKHRLSEHTILAMKTLVLSTTSDVGSNDPKISEYILQRITGEELQFLFKQYAQGCEKVNPCLDVMKTEDLNALVEALKKSQPEDRVSALTGLSFTELLSICLAHITEG